MKRILFCLAAAFAFTSSQTFGAPATLLFEDDFNRGIPGWTAVQPPGAYIDGPMRWQYDIVSGAYLENSNIYTDAAAASTSATAVMLINDTVAPAAFTYKARLVAGDDDGFGLVFGYKDPTNFFRVNFGRQNRTGFPWTGWNVDQKTNNVATNLFGAGTPNFTPSFVNRAGIPFDVTIQLDAQNRLTLTLVDDPDGENITYPLVENQPLPTSAVGKVGFMQWGQSGGTPRAFQILNPTLEPTPLVLNDQNQLSQWSPVVTLRADGTGISGALQPIWSLALGANGPLGVLLENSDIAPGNDASGQIDFPAGALVTGDTTWTNYVVKARMFSNDDDGYGLMLRYVDPSNFYRVAMRNQSSGTGIRRGLSVQKSVNGIFEEVFFEETPQYLFPGNVPFEISAAIITNTLHVLVRGNLNTTPTTFTYGPIDMAAGNVIPAGKPGVFAWAINRLEVDWFRVYSVDGVPLEVNSAFGVANPPAGLNSFAAGTVINASVPALVEDAPGRRRRATGWTGFGSVPATGTGNTVTFTLDAISSISWEWLTEYRLNVSAGQGGTVNNAGEQWLTAGSPVTVTATPNAGFMFSGWSGTSASLTPSLDLTMAQPFTLTANFKPDSDNDGLADDWETLHFGGLAQTAAADADNDSVSNAIEHQRGTNPNFAETEILANPFVSRWENVQRDPALPGVLIVRDFGAGFRGIWENSNDYREAFNANANTTFIPVEQTVPNVSFEGPRIIIRTNIWNPAWNDFTGSAIFSVSDNDGSCVYFRYQSESNWYRITINGNDPTAAWRAPFGMSVQKRSNGIFTELGQTFFIPDPSDGANGIDAGYKRFKVTVAAAGSHFDVKVIGWNVLLDPPAFDPASEVTLSIDDPDHPTGRFGVGTWGQGGAVAGGGANATNPVDAGVLIEDVVVEVGGAKVFEETWDSVPLAAELPAGWTGPANAGTWNRSAHGSIIQLSNFAPATTGTVAAPKADAESANLIGPATSAGEYGLEVGFHPFDSDGIGFVYDYVDANNFSRVLFVSAATADGRVPRGLNVSRKSNGTWTDIIVGDAAFVYTPGQPFTVNFSKNAQEHRLVAKNVDNDTGAIWAWPLSASAANPAFGLASWGEVDGHYEFLRVFSLGPATNPQSISITGVTRSGDQLTLTISNPAGGSVNVQGSADLAPNSWTTVAPNVTGVTVNVPLNVSTEKMFFRLSK